MGGIQTWFCARCEIWERWHDIWEKRVGGRNKYVVLREEKRVGVAEYKTWFCARCEIWERWRATYGRNGWVWRNTDLVLREV